jgi:hypothetical protein
MRSHRQLNINNKAGLQLKQQESQKRTQSNFSRATGAVGKKLVPGYGAGNLDQ